MVIDEKSLLFYFVLFIMVLSDEMHYNTTLTVLSDCPPSDTSCLSLDGDFIYSNSTKIVIKDTVLLLEPVIFSNLDSIAFFGEKGSKVNCSGNSGLKFVHVSNIVLYRLQLWNCSMLINNNGLDFKSAIYFVNSENVTIYESVFAHSAGIGMTLMNLTGTVNISNSNFVLNQFSKADQQEGGGLRIEMNNLAANYSINNCTFNGNNAYRHGFRYGSDGKQNRLRFGRGGGLFLITNKVKKGTIKISNCSFMQNSAQWGGGMVIAIVRSSENNRILVVNTTFHHNTSPENGGGGVLLYYYCSQNSLKNNSVRFINCSFNNNSAEVGGGLIVISHTSCNLFTGNELEFENCSWTCNTAKRSAAVDLTRRNKTSTLTSIFTHCRFINNSVLDTLRQIQDGLATQINAGLATFMVLYFRAKFQGSVVFENNNGTALLVISGIVSFSSINATFKNNRGDRGGAISLRYSRIEVFAHSHFLFIDNNAASKGGAIYSYNNGEHDIHNHVLRSCFIQNHDDDKQNTTFIFNNNYVGYLNYKIKNSIFAYPLRPCSYICNHHDVNGTVDKLLSPEDMFNCIGYVTSDMDNNNTAVHITGPGERYEVLEVLPLRVYPGIEFNLPIDFRDILNNSVNSSVKVWIKDSPLINNSYQYTSNKVVKLNGVSGESAVLYVRSSTFNNVDLWLNFTFEHCPPGFAQRSTPNECTCSCGKLKNAAYKGTKCLDDRSYIQSGFWIGYILSDNNSTTTPENLFSALCPLYFCSYNRSNQLAFYELPRVSTSENVDQFICGMERTGVLCGECRENRSVYFHSPYYECKENKKCKIGWLLYIITELLPLTVVYIIIVIFNVKLTSGAFNGFIFFAQIIETVGIAFNRTSGIKRFGILYWLIKGYELVYRSFNLDFFGVSVFSFCLWKGATTLDIIAIKYVTIAFAFALVLTTVLVMRYCTRCCKPIHRRSYVVHGLSAFLIFCYVQCVHTSFKLLIPSNMHGLCLNSSKYQGVFYSGNMRYFSSMHLIYALLALVCIMTIVTIPPILLLWYPAAHMLLGKCGLGESKIIRKLYSLNRLKPLLDSFQSCYKDNCRFFSGMYFLYRLFTLAAFAAAKDLDQFYLIVEMQLVLMLVFHSIAQPYKNKWHNILDTLLFADLAAINALSMFIRSQQNHIHANFQKTSLSAQALQVLLAYLPLLYIVTYITVCFVKKLKQRFSVDKDNTNCTKESDDDFPARLIYGSDESSSEAESEIGSYAAFADNVYKLNKL